MADPQVLWRQDGATGWITLNRPDSLNAWTGELVTELGQLLRGQAAADSVRAVVVTGSGRAFSSGADLRAGMSQGREGGTDLAAGLVEINDVILTVRALPKPVVAAVNGPAAGVGCSLALACDLVLAARSAYFLLAFVNIGLLPDGGATLLVPAAVGKARAFEMALLGERVSAERALEWGLVNGVTADEELAATATQLAGRLAAGPTRAYAATKAALNRSLYRGLEEQLEAEARAQGELGRSRDFGEGVAAFLERRSASFTGQ